MTNTRNKIINEDMEFITSTNIEWRKLKNTTILISGATGFLASYLVDLLSYLNEEKAYNIKVVALVRNQDKFFTRFPYLKNNKNIELMLHDLNKSGLEINQRIDYVFHAASNATPKFFGIDPVGTMVPNMLGTLELLQQATKNGAKCFLYFSTSGVYGHVNPKDYPIKETTFGSLDSMDIASCYLESKRVAETLCISWMKQYNLPIKVVRPAITYGPGIDEKDGRSFADFMWSIANNKNIELYSEGEVYRNFCYIADAICGIFYVLLNGTSGEAYNLASHIDTKIKDLAYLLVDKVFKEQNLKVEFKIKNDKNYLRKQFDRTTVDTTKLQKLGWDMKFSIEDGFKRSVEAILYEKGNI